MEPNDTRVFCPDIVSEHMFANTSERTVGTVMGVTCEEGTILSGKAELICEHPGFWSSPWPRCKKEDGGSDQLVIIIICAIATVVALAILIWAFYMLCANMNKERKVKAKRQEVLEQIREVTMFQAVSQDCVGMPPVIYNNINGTLRGRPANSEDESESTGTDQRSSVEGDSGTDKAIIF